MGPDTPAEERPRLGIFGLLALLSEVPLTRLFVPSETCCRLFTTLINRVRSLSYLTELLVSTLFPELLRLERGVCGAVRHLGGVIVWTLLVAFPNST